MTAALRLRAWWHGTPDNGCEIITAANAAACRAETAAAAAQPVAKAFTHRAQQNHLAEAVTAWVKTGRR